MNKAPSLADAQVRLATNLRRLRESKGIAQERLAWEAGVDRSYAGKIERGIANPSLNVLCRMADLLEVDVSALLQPPRSKAGERKRRA
ncbi:MAG: helix-turn-helix transcriptional regulator [Burkholderiales bacterium]